MNVPFQVIMVVQIGCCSRNYKNEASWKARKKPILPSILPSVSDALEIALINSVPCRRNSAKVEATLREIPKISRIL